MDQNGPKGLRLHWRHWFSQSSHLPNASMSDSDRNVDHSSPCRMGKLVRSSMGVKRSSTSVACTN